jgi:hypothetical protein
MYEAIVQFMRQASSWESAKAILSETYKLRIVEPVSSDYGIIRYVKDKSDFTQSIVNECRSVVIHKPTCQIVSVAPPKSLPRENWDVDFAQEFIDGTMINIFRHNGTIEIASRSRIGTAKTLFTEKTFEQMMAEAIEGKTVADIVPEGWSSASIVLQHPENRIVCPVTLPRIYIVFMTKIDADGVKVFYDPADWPIALGVYAIQRYDLSQTGKTAEQIDTFVNMKSLSHKHAWQGVVLYNAAGERTKIRNLFYQTVKGFRANDSCPEERYARLRKTRSLKRYLEYFPEDQEKFTELEGVLRAHTRNLYSHYVKTKITKENVLDDLKWPYKFHVGVIHRRYMNTLKDMKQKISLEYVITYVNELKYEDIANIIKAP